MLALRLQHAYRLLTHWRHRQRKVIDIAFTAGFTDLSYFNRSFRARFGMTPSDARAMAAADLGHFHPGESVSAPGGPNRLPTALEL